MDRAILLQKQCILVENGAAHTSKALIDPHDEKALDHCELFVQQPAASNPKIICQETSRVAAGLSVADKQAAVAGDQDDLLWLERFCWVFRLVRNAAA